MADVMRLARECMDDNSMQKPSPWCTPRPIREANERMRARIKARSIEAMNTYERNKLMTDPDLELNTDGNHDHRLVPLDPWERHWIAGALQSAMHSHAIVPPSASVARRLDDLLAKMRSSNPVPAEPN